MAARDPNEIIEENFLDELNRVVLDRFERFPEVSRYTLNRPAERAKALSGAESEPTELCALSVRMAKSVPIRDS